MYYIQQATKKLDENMEAMQHNFLLKGYFKKKAKDDGKKRAADIKNEQKQPPVVQPAKIHIAGY
jgi:phospholipid/cholesterol/gamma-HCH transport system substrate-binding protein